MDNFSLFCDFIEKSLPYGYCIQQGKILYIYSITKFKIDLSDKKRFGKYTLYHFDTSSHARSGKNTWHKQLETSSLYYAMYVAFTHDKFKTMEYFDTPNDFETFLNKFDRYRALLLIKQFFDKEESKS